jgi:galactokinase/mevalonate kinase-like predicted kinase
LKTELIVITAANAAQAKGYRAQLRGRAGYTVVPDPCGRRVGSLGATVNVLRRLSLPASAKVIICHSGGDARRTPGYAAMGKAFVPMSDSRPLLDHIIDEMRKLPDRPGVYICCGDVIPYFDAAKVKFADSGVTGIAYPDGPWQARRHGVYIERDGEVTGFLQKPDVKRGRFLIDTGIMYIDWPTARKMKKLPVAGDIYEEFPRLLLGGFARFSVSVVPKCRFFHIGSSRELLKELGRSGRLVDACAAPVAALGGNNIVTNVPASYGEVSLKKGECLTCLPLAGGGRYPLKYDIDDNFKADGLWEKHGLGEKMKCVDHARLLKLRTAGACSREVRVTAPVRIDFSGGWSDTPPICQREGGTVLAAAVTLDGKRPIEVVVRPRKDGFVKVVSKDLGKRRLIKSDSEIADHHDPHDWCALVKSALAVTGFKFGSRGLDIVMSADLPKGSGMGTSSILGSATVTALLVEAGRISASGGTLSEAESAEVAALTLRLEQEMRTGGGWEDQFGGLIGGIKLLRSGKGKVQKVAVSRLVGPKVESFLSELESRSLLYFTGQKRMARNVLRRVLGFYEENPHNFAKILIGSLKAGAERAAAAVSRCDMDEFARCVNGYWRDKKLLDAGSTNDRVEEIVAKISGSVSAVTLAGAGGGGFMYILAKSPKAAAAIRKKLTDDPPSKFSRFYSFAVDGKGMEVSYL